MDLFLLADVKVVDYSVDGEAKPARQDVEVFPPGMAVRHNRHPI